MIERINNTVSWFFSHKVLIGVCTVICTILAVLSYLDQHNSDSPSLSKSEQKNPRCIEKPIQFLSQNDKLNLPESLSYLSGCYVDGCYTYQLKITDLVETDISNQFLKGLDWHVGVSVSETKAGGRTLSTVKKIRSNDRSLDAIRTKNTVKLDEQVHVWLDALNICNRKKHK